MISVPNGELKGREMRGREREVKQVLQCVPLVLPTLLPLLPAPTVPFSSLHESPFRSCFKSLTFKVLYHDRNPADQHQLKGPRFCYLFLVLETPSNSKVFPSFITVFMKTKVLSLKFPTCWVPPLLGSLGVNVP